MTSTPSRAPTWESSPRVKARIAGVLWLIVIVGGLFAEVFVRSSLIARGDSAATAANILGSEPLFRLGIVADLIAGACYLGATVLVCDLLRPVNRTVSNLAQAFVIAGSAIAALNELNLFAPLVLLGGAFHPIAFDPGQLRTLSFIFIRLYGIGSNISLVFFSGVYLLLTGWLIFRSGFWPKLIGIFLVVAGLGYLTNSFAAFLAPALARSLSPYILLPGLLGEGSLTLWLIVVGVNVPRWEAQAIAAGDYRSPTALQASLPRSAAKGENNASPPVAADLEGGGVADGGRDPRR